MSIEFKSVSFKYPNNPNIILDNISFKCEDSSLTAFIGYSGVGKTTILHLILGILKPDSGEIFINGKNISEFSKKELINLKSHDLGIIFQSFHIIPYLNVEENITLPQLFTKNNKISEVEIDNILDKVGLKEFKYKKASELSGGQRQRIAIARALINNPQIILADEPTGNTDIDTSKQIFSLLTDLAKKENKTVLIVTHDSHLMHDIDQKFQLEEGHLLEIKN